MIPRADITAWKKYAPWETDAQVEQDLVISRGLVEIFHDPFLNKKLAFRGGTAIHKLYLLPSVRYSEDIDLVQIEAGPIGEVFDRVKERLEFLGKPRTRQKSRNNTMIFSKIIDAFYIFLDDIGCSIPRKEFHKNMIKKLDDHDFRDDIRGLIRTDVDFNIDEAWKLVSEKLVSKMK